VAVATAIPLLAIVGYMGALLVLKFGILSARPDTRTLGTVARGQLAHDMGCPAVTVTPQATWLLSSTRNAPPEQINDPNVIHLDRLVYGKDTAVKQRPRLFESNYFSYLSILEADGHFRLVATVGDQACLQPTPDGRAVYLLTSLEPPEDAAAGAVNQSAVFRSDDQGKSWVWQREGYMAPSPSSAAFIKSYVHGADIWTVTSVLKVAKHPSMSDFNDPLPVLLYSADEGKTAEVIRLDRAMLADRGEIQKSQPADAKWWDEAPGDRRVHIAQLDAQRAVVWVSQRFLFHLGEGDPLRANHSIRLTHQAELKRVDGQWHAGAIKRLDGLFIWDVREDPEGRVISLADATGEGNMSLVTLDKESLTWVPQHALPSPFDPLFTTHDWYDPDLWAGRRTLIVSTGGGHNIPRWIYPWGSSPARILASAFFYSADEGRSWRRLALPRDYEIIGFDSARDEVFLARPWYHYPSSGAADVQRFKLPL
jgi:hypothetical protein